MYPTAYKDPRGGHNRSSINQTFFQLWSPSMFYVLGFIFADGAIEDVQRSSRTCYIAITSQDISILENIKKVMDSKHNLYKRLPQLITFPSGKNYLTGEEFTLRIGSKTMYNDLLKLGVTPRKSLTIIFPKIPSEYLSFFIRGYFDGDGCATLKKKRLVVVFTSGSRAFLEGLAINLSNVLQIPIKSLYSQSKGTGNLCYSLYYNSTISKKILEFMYKDLEKAPYLDRKFAIYQKYLQSQN